MAKVENFEEKIIKLENLIESLENEDLSLDESMKHYKGGTKLLKECNEYISEIEKELEIIKKDN